MNTPTTLVLLTALTGCAYQPPATQAPATQAPATQAPAYLTVDRCRAAMITVLAHMRTTTIGIDACYRDRSSCLALATYLENVKPMVRFDMSQQCLEAGYVSNSDPILRDILRESPKFTKKMDKFVAFVKREMRL